MDLTFPSPLRLNLDPDHFLLAPGASDSEIVVPELKTDGHASVFVAEGMEVQRASVLVVTARGLTTLSSRVLQVFQVSDFHQVSPIFASFPRTNSRFYPYLPGFTGDITIM
jgi:hypothetical protein